MDLRNFFVFASVVLNFLLGLVIHFRAVRKKANLAFEFTIFSIVGWCLTMFMFRQADPESVLFWGKLLYFFPTFIPAGFILFGLFFPDYQVNKVTLSLILLANLIMASLALLPNAVVRSVTIPPTGENIIKFGWAYYYLYIFYIPFLFLASYFVLFKRYFQGTPLVKQQILYIFLGLTGASTIGITTNLILPTLNYFDLNWLGQVTTFIWVGCATYAIIKHRLMDIRLVVARTVSYSLLVTILGGFYTLSMFLISSFFLPMPVNGNQLIISASLALIIAFSFQPLRRLLERITDRIFFKEKYEPEELLGDLSRIMASTLDLQKLAQEVLKELLDQMKINRGALILVKNSHILRIESSGYKEKPVFKPAQVRSLMTSRNQGLVFDELPEKRIKHLMRRLDLTFCITLEVKEKKIGLLVLSEKSSGDIYASEDIELLEILAPQLAVAIQNSQAYEEIQRFSLTLKEEVDQATKQLKRANLKLKELDKMKDEFVSVASHELRTPMTSIKNYVWMVLHGKGGKITKKQRFYLGRAQVSTERLIHLVEDMLTISRIEGGRLETKPTQGDVTDLAASVIVELKEEADEKKIKLCLKSPKKKLPPVMLDKERIRQVLFNLIGNALKFTEAGGKITVSFEKKNSLVSTLVTDTGKGIAKSDIPKLFKKFGRLDRSFVTVAKTGGTGLGLFICKQIIDLHGGKIGVRSKLGQGSTFYFDLKIAKRG